MGYAIVGVGKIKSMAKMNAASEHNLRLADVPNADKNLEHMNDELVSTNGKSYTELFQEKIKTIPNRICAIDMNPNYIGFSIIDWKNDNSFVLIDKGILSLKPLNDYDFSLKEQNIFSVKLLLLKI